MKWLKRFILALSVILLLSTPVRAAEKISNFDSKITVLPSGRVEVTETIAYDFGYASRHGIFRYIPVVYRDNRNQVYKPSFAFDSVRMDGQTINYETKRSGDNEVLKIGDANRTITGPHTYTITYHFDSLLIDKGGDLLRFNVTGSGWEVPIARASATINGPASPELVCYAGIVGSNNKDCQIDRSTSRIMTSNVGNGQDFTIEAFWPSGTVSGLLQPYKMPWWVIGLIIAGVLYVLAGLGFIVAAVIRWLGIRHAEKRAQRQQTIIAQYKPPKDLTAGEMGFLTDSKTSMVEVTAMLIQAAVAGYIKIEQVAEKTLFKKAEYKLTKLKDFAMLGMDEVHLLITIFDAKSEINLKDINKTTTPGAITKYKEGLRTGLQSKGLYTKTSKFVSVGAIAGLIVFAIFIFTPFIFLIAAAILPLGIYLYKRAGQTPRLTPEGLKTWAHLEGFKLFLSVTEKDRLAFTDAPARTPRQFSKFLPYAIALGVEKEWAQQFEGIDIEKSLNWYGGHGHAFTAGYLAGSLSDSFASVVATSVAPQTSSGGFGGGSSGGGFGGGGGGSW